MKRMDRKMLLAAAAKIRLAVFDVDGVLTDGGLILGESGDEYKVFHVHDGHGLVMLAEAGCRIAVVTARSSRIVAERMAALGIEYVYQDEKDKGDRVARLMTELEFSPEQVAYTGDDIIDLPAMSRVGLPIAVADAHTEVRKFAAWTTEAAGGRGAVREVCELIMQAQGKLETRINAYLSNKPVYSQ